MENILLGRFRQHFWGHVLHTAGPRIETLLRSVHRHAEVYEGDTAGGANDVLRAQAAVHDTPIVEAAQDSQKGQDHLQGAGMLRETTYLIRHRLNQCAAWGRGEKQGAYVSVSSESIRTYHVYKSLYHYTLQGLRVWDYFPQFRRGFALLGRKSLQVTATYCTGAL